MRSFHSTALALLVLLHAGTLSAQPPAAPPGQSATNQLSVFVRGVPVGVEDVTVTRSAEGTTITGTARIGAPSGVTVRKAEIRYGPEGQPLGCHIEGAIRDRLVVVAVTVSGTSAAWSLTEGTNAQQRTDTIDPQAVILPPIFFGGYEVFAWRLPSMKPGDTMSALVPGQGQRQVKVLSASDERIQTPAGLVSARRTRISIDDANRPLEVEIWADQGGRLVRFSVPSQFLEVVRSDVASVAARQVQVSHPGDEQVQMPANGFTLAGTLSKPASAAPARGGKGAGKPARLPAIVLVGGTGMTDREEATGGVPVFGHLASALADAGFLAVRYDRRGVGQSGGRGETATIADYAEDVRAVVKYLRKRKDVDQNRVAVLGYGEGGMVALLAAADHGDIKAIVLAAAPGGTGADMVLEQQRHALARLNLTEADRQARIDLQRRIQQAVLGQGSWEGIPPEMRRQADTPLFASLLAFDPAKVIPKTKQPLLIVHGSLDKQVEPSNAETLAALGRLRKRPAGDAVTVTVVPGVNHLLVPATTGEVNEYGTLTDKTIAPAVVEAVTSFLNEKMPARK